MELLPILTFITLGAVILFAVRSKMQTEEKLKKITLRIRLWRAQNPTQSCILKLK